MTINGFDADTLLTEAQMTRVMGAGYNAMGVYFTKSRIFAGMPVFIQLCAKHSFKLWLIDEGMGNAAVFARGNAGGQSDGRRAASMARELGVPAETPIYFAIDYAAGEADVPNIRAYYVGYKAGCAPYKAGMYADGLIASAIETDVGDYVPGASGWPGTAEYLKSGKVALIQHPPVPFFGMNADPVEVIDESVLWAPGGATVAPVPPPETPPSTMATLMQGDSGSDVHVLQAILGVPWLAQSSTFDAATEYLVKAFQATHGLTVDGIVGPATWAALTRKA